LPYKVISYGITQVLVFLLVTSDQLATRLTFKVSLTFTGHREWLNYMYQFMRLYTCTHTHIHR